MKRKGFTLLELIIVIVILGIIAAIVIPSMVEQREKEKIEAVDTAAEKPVKKTPEIPAVKKTTIKDQLTSIIYEVAVLKSIGNQKPTLKEIWPDVAARTGVELKGWLNCSDNTAIVSTGEIVFLIDYDQTVGIVRNIEEL